MVNNTIVVVWVVKLIRVDVNGATNTYPKQFKHSNYTIVDLNNAIAKHTFEVESMYPISSPQNR